MADTSIEIFNSKLAEKIKQSQLISSDVLDSCQRGCNKESKNLGQVLVQQNLLSVPQLVELVKAVSTVDANSDFPSLDIIALDGKSFGDFEIIEEIARGGMGIVYKAKQKGINREVALKVIFKGKEAEEHQIRRFLREGKIIAQLDHPNIIPLYNMGQVQGYHYLTMRYINGGTFQDLIENIELPLRDKLQPLIKVSRALHRAHRQKILHRDIKPSNILLDKSGEPYLTDFGLAKQTDQESFNLTGSSDILGTPCYMSPEQVQSQHDKVGPTSDIYSMGVLLYHLITRRLPFAASNMTALFVQIVEKDPVAPIKIDSTIPEALQDICLKAMHKTIALRYQSMSAFASELERFCRGKDVNARKERYRLRFHSYLRQNRRYLLGLAMLLPIFLALLIWWQIARQRRLEEARQSSPKYQWQIAQQRFSEKKYQVSLENLEKLLTACPLHPQGMILKAKILAIEKCWDQARLLWMQIAQTAVNPVILEWLAQNAFKAGFLEEARDYCAKAIGLQPKNESLSALMGNILLYCGQLAKAKEYFQRVKRIKRYPEMLLSQALLSYYRDDYQRVKQYLAQSEAVDSSPFSQIRGPFLRTRMMWQGIQQDLMTWEWLFGSEQQAAVPIKKKLREILARLEKSSALLHKISENYLTAVEKQNIEIYLIVVRQELAPLAASKNNLTKFVRSMEQPNLASTHKILLHKAHIRYLLRCQKWAEVYRLCNSAVRYFPWEKDFYHLRLLAGFHLQDVDEWTKDIAKVNEIKRLDFTPLCNLLLLLGDKPDQKKFYESYPKILYYSGKMALDRTEKLFFSRYYADWTAQQSRQPEIRQRLTSQELEQLWHKALHSDSAPTRIIAGSLIALHHDNPTVKSKINSLALLPGDSEILKVRKQELLALIAKQRRRQKLKELRQLLLQFSVGQDSTYVLQAMNHIPNLLPLLDQLISDENEHPLARLYAVKMLAVLRTNTSEKSLRQIYQRGYPFDLLVSCASRKKNEFSCQQPLPPRFFNERNLFFRMLAALYLPLNQHRPLLRRLLQRDKEIVAICAACNFRMSSDRSDDFIEVSDRLQQFLSSREIFIKLMAQDIFWTFGKSIKHKFIMVNHWRRHSHLLLKMLQQEEPLQIMAVLSLINEKEFHEYLLNEIDASNDPVWRKIVQKVSELRQNASSYTLRFLSAFLLSFSCNDHDGFERVQDWRTPFYIRMSITFGIMLKRSFLNFNRETLLLFRSFAIVSRRKNLSIDDQRIFRYSFLVRSISIFAGRKIGAMHSRNNDQYLRSEDYAVKKMAVSTLLWTGKAEHIAKVCSILKESKDFAMRKVAVATLAALYSLYEPDKIDKFNAWLAGQDPVLRRSAAFGYYSLILRQFLVREYFQFVDYQIYITKFRERSNKKWIDYLKNCIAVAPSIRYLYEIALCYLIAGKSQPAIAAIDRALKLDQESKGSSDYHLRLQILLAEVYLKIGDFQKAIAVCQQALRNNPLDWRIYEKLAFAWAKLGCRDKADAYAKRASQFNNSFKLSLRYLQKIGK